MQPEIFEEFIEREIIPRKAFIEDRITIYSWTIDQKLPSFIQEKIEEIKLMVILGFDNFALKNIILLIEEVLMYLVIAKGICYEEDYIPLLDKYKKHYGHQLLNLIKDDLQQSDFDYCTKYCHDEAHGGLRLRNVEIHNLLSDKIKDFEIRSDILGSSGANFPKELIEEMIKKKPSFIHIAARDMTTRNILHELAGIFELLNRNAHILNIFNNLPDKTSIELENSLPTSQEFFVSTITRDYPVEEIIQHVLLLGDVINVEPEVVTDENGVIKKVINFMTSEKHSSLDVMIAIETIIAGRYSINTGIKV